MLAYSYIRFSTPDQLKGDSLRRQLEKSEKYAAKNNLTLDTSLNMRDLGLSAFDKSNVIKGQLGGFLKAIEQGRVAKGSYLLVESLDRLSRAKVMDALGQFNDILKAGIVIVTLSDEQVYSEASVGDNFTQLIISILIMARAHEESLMKSKRVGAAWKNKRKQVIESGKLLTRRTPMWITVVNDKLQLVAERAEVVKRVYEMARQGIGNHTIVKTLNSKVPAWNKVGSWQTSYVQKLLKNPAAYGAIDIDGTMVEGYFPAVITKDEWNYIATLRSSRKSTERAGTRKGQGVSNLFSGILRCGYCGAGMVMSGYVETRRGAHKRRKYVMCNGAKTGATECGCIQWDYDDFESLFLINVHSLKIEHILGNASEASITEIREHEEYTAHIRSQLQANKKKIENLYIAIEEDPVPGLVKRVRELEDADEKLTNQLTNAERSMTTKRMGTTATKGRIALILQLFREQKIKSDDEKRLLREALSEQIKAIVAKIDMYPSGPTFNRSKAAKEMRYCNVYFKTGTVIEVAAG